MAIDKKTILNKYMFVVGIVFTIAIFILISAGKTVFVEGSMWRKYAETLKKEDIIVKPDRGNIYSSDGQLMASSVPLYYVYMDMKANGMKLDTLRAQIDSLSKVLSNVLKERSAADYKRYILTNYGKTTMLPLSRSKISYLQFKEVCKAPYLRFGWNLSCKRMVQRVKPFGSLASRTIGDIYGDDQRGEGNKIGKNGLELSFDSLLIGKQGKSTRMRVRGRWENVNVIEPENGLDIVSTIDIGLQDIAEKALVDMLISTDAQSGVAVLMEVKTGKVKACVNMDRLETGIYEEVKNRVVADEGEPGSTFKVASMMVALEDGVVQPTDSVETGNGLFNFYGSEMRDHNANKGGYGTITAAKAIWFSSNVGVSKIINKNYHDNPGKFVDGLYRIGLNKVMNLEIPGAGKPKIRYPSKANWSATALPWMSIGYEVNIPPIYTLAFFNAIANNGKMIRPYFLESVQKEGETIAEYGTETINSSICSDRVLKEIQKMLECVVDSGTAQAVHSDFVKIAGKTGTAQISQGALGYTAGGKSHQVTFCGYFPSDKPAYTCICQIRAPRIGYPSGGAMSGVVVKTIAEQTYARALLREPDEIEVDSDMVYAPAIKGGMHNEVITALKKLNIKYSDSEADDSEWTKVKLSKEDNLELTDARTVDRLVPNVIGMSAKDAVYLLEKSGLNVNMNGMGAVYKQSIQSGSIINKGTTISLSLK